MKPIDFTTFVLSIASAAYMGLGLVPPEAGQTASTNYDLAKQNIDLLEMIFEKTKGNRTPDEDRLIEQLLFELRMRFIESSKKKS
jgi:hypothetical protein